VLAGLITATVQHCPARQQQLSAVQPQQALTAAPPAHACAGAAAHKLQRPARGATSSMTPRARAGPPRVPPPSTAPHRPNSEQQQPSWPACRCPTTLATISPLQHQEAEQATRLGDLRWGPGGSGAMLAILPPPSRQGGAWCCQGSCRAPAVARLARLSSDAADCCTSG
jgi:hypothetical protein